MAEWRVIYAGLRERFPELDRTVVRATAESCTDEEQAASFLSSLRGHAVNASLACESGLPRVVSSQGATGEVFSLKTREGPLFNEEVQSSSLLGASKPAEDNGATTCEKWGSYVEAALTAAACQEPEAAQAGCVTGVSASALKPVPAVADLLPMEERTCGAKGFVEETRSLDDAASEQEEVPTLEMLVLESFEEKERLAAELAAYAQLQTTVATRELEVDASRERAKVAGETETRKMLQSQEAVACLREENERRCGEVHGELAMLATEANELRRNLALLKEERGTVRQTLERLQEGLHARVASAEAAIGEADAEGDERRAEAQAALDVVEARLAVAELEKADLDRQEAEANKLHHFIMEKGASVDSMLAEVAMLREDLSNLELLAAGSSLARPFRSSFLAVGQAGSALRRSSHSQGEAVLNGVALLKEGLQPETNTEPGSSANSVAGGDEEGLEGLPPLLLTSGNADASSVQSTLHLQFSSLPSPLSQSAHSAFQSANTSLRMSQALAGLPSNLDAGPAEEVDVLTAVGSKEGSPRGFHMGLYGPSPMNLTSQYMGVFQQQVLPRVYVNEQHEDEGWAVLESDSSSSGTQS